MRRPSGLFLGGGGGEGCVDALEQRVADALQPHRERRRGDRHRGRDVLDRVDALVAPLEQVAVGRLQATEASGEGMEPVVIGGEVVLEFRGERGQQGEGGGLPLCSALVGVGLYDL